MKKTTPPSAVPEATPAPAKKAVRKTAAKKAVPATPALPPAPIVAAKPARKVAAKKVSPAAKLPVVVPVPVKKTAAKKAVLKQRVLALVTSPPMPAPAPSAAVKTAAAPKARAPRKAVSKKTAPAPAESLPELPPAPVESSPGRPTPSASPSDIAQAPHETWRPGQRPSPYPPRQPRPYPPRDPATGPSAGSDGPAPAPQPYPSQENPPGEPRRLTKWERWKERKEKFKQQKQQRYLEHTGRAPVTGPRSPTGETDSQDRREPQDRREFPDRREPRQDPRHEPRQWEPRPPRPEIPLGPPEDCSGLLEMTDKGFAFLRPKERGFIPSPNDPFVSAELVRQHGLREGVWVDAVMQRGGRGPQVTQLKKVNGLEPSAYRILPLFEELTAINPNKRYILETEGKRHTTRLIDFISPIGRGQRGLIVAPPRAGKTTFLQHIAEAILHNYEDVKVIVLLVDERPEEVTEIARALPGAEIMASSNDQDPRNHIRMASLAVERAKRLVEAGQHVFMLLDSITRLARGFNNAMRGGGGKAMSGGLDSRALEAPRRLFAAARNTREAGSLTIMATALVETNNKGDDLIFQEFKGTGNMELVLDRKISQAYVYPAVDIFKSGTRREELLLPPHQLEKVHLIRRGLSGHRPQEAVERLLQIMGKYNNNNQMLIEIKARGE
jgi:transcription termination factor Rho